MSSMRNRERRRKTESVRGGRGGGGVMAGRGVWRGFNHFADLVFEMSSVAQSNVSLSVSVPFTCLVPERVVWWWRCPQLDGLEWSCVPCTSPALSRLSAADECGAKVSVLSVTSYSYEGRGVGWGRGDVCGGGGYFDFLCGPVVNSSPCLCLSVCLSLSVSLSLS